MSSSRTTGPTSNFASASITRRLRAINQRIVYASISGFGQDGPYRERPGFDQIAQGMGGLMSITGLPGQGPVRVGIPVADLGAGIFCAMGILVALLEREVSGEGQWVQISLLAGADLHARFPGRALADRQGGARARPATTIRPASRPACFPTSDGHINIAAAGDESIAALLPGARSRGICATIRASPTGAARSNNRNALNAEIGVTQAKHRAPNGSRC